MTRSDDCIWWIRIKMYAYTSSHIFVFYSYVRIVVYLWNWISCKIPYSVFCILYVPNVLLNNWRWTRRLEWKQTVHGCTWAPGKWHTNSKSYYLLNQCCVSTYLQGRIYLQLNVYLVIWCNVICDVIDVVGIFIRCNPLLCAIEYTPLNLLIISSMFILGLFLTMQQVRKSEGIVMTNLTNISSKYRDAVMNWTRNASVSFLFIDETVSGMKISYGCIRIQNTE